VQYCQHDAISATTPCILGDLYRRTALSTRQLTHTSNTANGTGVTIRTVGIVTCYTLHECNSSTHKPSRWDKTDNAFTQKVACIRHIRSADAVDLENIYRKKRRHKYWVQSSSVYKTRNWPILYTILRTQERRTKVSVLSIFACHWSRLTNCWIFFRKGIPSGLQLRHLIYK
jgi:hypothetical protein